MASSSSSSTTTSTSAASASASASASVPAAKADKPQHDAADIYEDKDEAYFGYYALLSHQAQMLQDSVRTATYQQAIIHHANDCFRDKIVMDVGAGNGILSFFSAQAGAKRVFAVEASNMVDYLHKVLRAAKPASEAAPQRQQQQQAEEDRQEEEAAEAFFGNDCALTASALSTSASSAAEVAAAVRAPRNAWLADTLVPVHSKVEDVTAEHLEGHQQVDTIVSECLGVLLVHERMCESFLDARDRFLKPGGSVFPSAGTICLAPFEDKQLWEDTANKARWWRNNNFYGVDLTPFAASAFTETFSSPVVGVFASHCLLSVSSDYVIDFATISKAELQRFTMPVEWTFAQPAIVHGLGGWFDLHFNSQSPAAAAAGGAGGVGVEGEGDRDGDATMQDPGAAKQGGLSGSAAGIEPATGSELDAASMGIHVDTVKAAAVAAAAAAASAASAAVPTTNGTGQFMTTSPYATPTHWQQVRFLLPEPVAVNRGQKLVGSIQYTVNDSRSYTLKAHFDVVRADGQSDPSLHRKAKWRLDRQTYSWS
ncbi:hypothetical protein ACQY0O_008308 [Thecaphora frezii]